MDKEAILRVVRDYFEVQIPFNRLLGLEIGELAAERVELRVRMRPELVGNSFFGILHGGVTSAVLDVAGGLIAMVNVVESMDDISDDAFRRKLTRLGTIDLRVDYLRPGRGELFTATARVIRKGNKVAVTRMELHNELGEEIALGTATYLVG